VAKDAIGALRDILVTNWSKPPEPSIEDIADLDKGDAKRVRMLDNDVIRIFETAHNEAQPELIYDYVNEHVNITIDCRTVDSRERLSEMRDEVRRIIHAFRKGDNNNFDRLIYKTRTDLSDRSKKLFRYTLQCEIITFSLLATAVDPVVNPADGSVSGANTFQSYDGDLTTLAAMTPSDSVFIVGNGVNWVAESGATARTSLGLGTIATQDSDDVSITGGSINGVAIGTSTTGVVYSITANTGITANQAAGAVTLNVGGLTVSELAANSLQVSSESFADNDTSLMTSAAIQDKILSYGYAVLADITSGVDLTAGTGMLIQSETNTASGDYSATITIDLKDEDNMASNSATHAASQQSIKAYVDNEVTSLIDSAPGALDTLNELAAAINDDASYFSTINTALGNRIRADASQSFTTTQKAQARTNIGLNAGSVPTAGTGIDISGSGEFSVDVSDFMSSGVNNYLLTATGADTFQGESTLTYDGQTLRIDNGGDEVITIGGGGSGYQSIELGGDTGAYIDLKSPNSDDYDIRIITTGNGGEILTASPLTFKTSNNNDDITFAPHGTGKVKIGSGGTEFTFPTARGTSGQVLKTGSNGVIAWGTDDNDNHTYAISSATVTGGANLVLTAGGSGSGTDTVKLAGGTNTTVSQESDVITIVSSDTTYSTNSSTSGSDARINLVAGGSGSGTDYITIAGGSNVQIAETGDTITISSTTATTYDLLVAQTLGDNNDPVLRLDPSTGSNDDITITGGSNVTVTRNSGTQLTIASTDTNTQNVFATTFVDDSNDALLRLTKSGASSGTQDVKFVAGANITLTPDTSTSPQQLTIAGVPSANDATITLTAGTGLSGGGDFTTDQSSGETITFNVDTGTIATKSYVDGLKQGLDTKDSVRVATTANITLSGTQTIDGVSVQANDRVLVKDQSTGSQNGIYVASASAWARAADADANADVTAGLYVWVEEGTANGDQGWILTTNDDITVGSTALTFTQFSGTGQITAGTGMTKSGNTLNVGGLSVSEMAGSAVQTSSEVSSFGNNDTSFLTAAGIKNYIEANSFGFLQSVAVANIAGSAIQTGSESFADNDTTIMTSAAIQDKIEAYGYTTNTGDITGVDLTVTSPITIASETNTTSGSYSATLGLADPATLTQLTESTDATDDKIILWDEDASAWKYMTLDDLQDSIDTAGGGGIAFDGSTANGVLTYKDADEASVESTLTYDPSGLLNIVSSGYGRIEMQGDSGAYIDLKNSTSDDFDVRFITDGTGLDITTSGSNHITLKTNGSSRFKVEDAQTTMYHHLTFGTTSNPYIKAGTGGPLAIRGDEDGLATSYSSNTPTYSTAASIQLRVNASNQTAMEIQNNKDIKTYGFLKGGSHSDVYGANTFLMGVTSSTADNDWFEVFRWTPKTDGGSDDENWRYDNFQATFQVTARGIGRSNFNLHVRGEYGVQDSNGWWTKEFIIDGWDDNVADDDTTFKMVYNAGTGGSTPYASLYQKRDEDWEYRQIKLIQCFTNCYFDYLNTNVGETDPTHDTNTGSANLDPSIRRKLYVDSNEQLIHGVAATGIYLDNEDQELLIKTDTNPLVRAWDTTDNYSATLTAQSSGAWVALGDMDTAYDSWMKLGAYSGINNLDTKTRDFHLYGTNSATGFYFDESAGTFGIGTTTPGHKLHVSGPPDDSGDYAIYADEGADNYAALVNRHSANRRTALFYRNIHADYTAQPMVEIHNDHTDDDQPLLILKNDGTGKDIQWGTTNTFIQATQANYSDLTVAADDDLILHADDDVIFQPGGSNTHIMLNTGELGLGTTAPLFPLHLKYTDDRTDPEGSGSSSGAGAIGASAQGGGLYIENASTTDGSWAGVTFRTDTADARIAYKSVGSSLTNEGQMSFYLDTNDSPNQLTLEEVFRLRGGASGGNQTYNSVEMPVNNTHLKMGSTGQLEMKFDGSHTRITHNAATDSWMIFKNEDGAGIQFNIGTEKGIEINKNGNVELYYDDTKSFETTSAGGTLTGALTVTGAASAVGSLTVNYAGSDVYADIIGPNNRDLRFVLRDNGDGDSFLFRNAAGTDLLDINRTGTITTSGNMVVGGDLTVSGTTTTINTTNLAVEDNIVVLNSNVTGTPADVDAGIEVERGDTTNATFLFDEGDNCWKSYTPDTGNSFQAINGNGYIALGPQNGTYAHINTDVSKFYFNKQIVVDEGIVSSYNENLILRRAMSSDEQITIADNSMTFESANNQVMHIDGTNSRVGIGTTSPTGTLSITSGGHDMIHLNRTVNNEGYGMGIIGRAGNDASTTAAHEYAAMFFQIEDHTDGSEKGGIAFHTSSGGTAADSSSTHAMQITSGGLVGIGDTTPSTLLEIVGVDPAQTGDYKSHLRIIDTTSSAAGVGGAMTFGGYQDATSTEVAWWAKISGEKANATNDNRSGQLHFWTRKEGANPAKKMMINEDGYVGIGTSTPAVKLDVRDGDIGLGHLWDSASTTTAVNIGKQDANGGWAGGSAFMSFLDSSSTSNSSADRGTGIAFHVHQWGVATAEKVKFTAKGMVGIGTAANSTTPAWDLSIPAYSTHGIALGRYNDFPTLNVSTGGGDPLIRVAGRTLDAPGIIEMAMFDANAYLGAANMVLGRVQFAMNETANDGTPASNVATPVANIEVTNQTAGGAFDAKMRFKTSDGDVNGPDLKDALIIDRSGSLRVKADSNTLCLIHGDSQFDYGPSGHSLTLSGATPNNVRAANKKYEGNSYYFDANASYITFPVTSDFDFGTGDYTIEMWVQFDDVPSGGSNQETLCELGTYQDGVMLRHDGNSNEVEFWSNGTKIIDQSWTASADTWYHFAVVRKSSTVYLYIDGVEQTNVSNSDNLSPSSETSPTTGSGVIFGQSAHTATEQSLQGWMDGIRISDVARYKDRFTPPIRPFSTINGEVFRDWDNLHASAQGDGGYLGIGTASPSEPLHVVNDDSGPIARFERTGQESIYIGGSNGWGNLYTSDAVLGFGTGSSTGGSSQMVLSSDKLGIGTTSPSERLHVSGGDIYLQNGDFHITQGSYKIKNASNGNQAISFPSSGNLLVEGVDTEFQGNVKSTGSFVDKNSRIVSASSQLLDVQWAVGTASDSNGYYTFTQNGSTNENSRVWGDTPSPYYPQRGILWQMTNMDAGGGDGGWETTSFPVDHTKTYRFSVFARQESPQSGSGSMTVYFGTRGYGSTNGLVHVDNDNVNTNPYFWSGDLPETGKWYLIVGHVLGSGDTDPDTNIYGGIYDVDTGKKEANITDSFRWHTDTTTSRHRAYLFYYDDTGNTDPDGYFFGPRVDLCDGTEPPISSLINGGYFYSTKASTMVTIANDNASADADATLRLLSQHGSDTWTDLTEDTYGNFEITGGGSTRRSIMKMTDHDTTTGTLEFNREHFDWDTKIYADSATPAIMVDGSTDRVGIHNASPAYAFDVAGAGRFTGNLRVENTLPALLLIDTDATNDPTVTIMNNAGALSLRADSENVGTGGRIEFTTSGTERMRLTDGGNFGIGTTSPDTLFEIKEGGTGAAVMRLRNSNTSYPDDTAFGRIEFYNADSSGAGITAQIEAISDASGRGGQLAFKTDPSGTSPSTRMLIQGDGDIDISGGMQSTSTSKGWNLWHSVQFAKLDYGTTAGSGAALQTLGHDDNEAGVSNYSLEEDITIRAVVFRTNGVVLSGTVAQQWRIFANGSSSVGTLTNISLDAGDFTRQDSENANATAHYYTVTGLNASYNKGDTLSIKRQTGAVDMGDVYAKIYYSIDN